MLGRLLLLLLLMPGSHAMAQGSPGPDLRDFRRHIHQAVWDRVIAGGAWWVSGDGWDSHGCYGFRVRVPVREQMTEDTVFDLASLTKVVATTPCVMRLVEEGRIDLEKPVAVCLPEFTGGGREHITVRHLMTHTSGLKPGLPREPAWSGYAAGIALACAAVPEDTPGGRFRYSDINFILLGEVVRRVAGAGLEDFARKTVFGPLGMKDTSFTPDASRRARAAATEHDECGVLLRGVVHDPTARRMGGVAGHAGLFSTATDVSRYARMVLNGGELDGVRVLKPETVRCMTAVHTPPTMPEKRALGWDVDTRYSRPRGGFKPGAGFGHTGFTGTCLWIEPEAGVCYIFLASRLHETDRDSDHRRLFDDLGTALATALGR